MIEFSELKGKTLTKIYGLSVGSEEVIFHCKDNSKYKMFHIRDCCEYVDVNEIHGDINDLLDTEILLAEEVTDIGDIAIGSYTWTFYKLSTIKGDVTIKWYGESNGYYSERVDIEKIA